MSETIDELANRLKREAETFIRYGAVPPPVPETTETAEPR